MSLKSSRKRVAQAEDYESDDGFVEDAPKTKKAKASSARTVNPISRQEDEDGNPYWELSGKRRLQVTSFKGSTFVGIREFYEKDGKALPGKKGISLSVEQYATLVELMPQIEAALKDKGLEVPRPNYEDGSESASPGNDGEQNRSDGNRAQSQREVDVHKKNHEATSDEEDEDD